MNDAIICPHCKKQFAASQAFSHQLEEERIKIREQEHALLRKKIEEEMLLKLKDSKNEIEEMKEQNKLLKDQVLEIHKKSRESERKYELMEIENQKRLKEAELKIRDEEQKRAKEENNLKFLEQEKKIKEQQSALEEMKRKLEQGSQQTQGEVLEEYLENHLKGAFVNDLIEPVAKGIRGADVMQTVRNNFGKSAGKIIWESKRTKAWSNDWIAKLKSDMRTSNADSAVLVSNILPNDIKTFGYQHGIWITNYESFIGLATALRIMLINIASAKHSTHQVNDKKEVLYEYVRSTEFRHKVEAIAEAFSARLQDLEVEKRWFMKKWVREEKTIRSLITNTDAMYADFQSILGKELAELQGVGELPEHAETVVTEDKLL